MVILKKNIDLFLIKLFSVTSMGVVLRSFLGFVSQKVVAVYLGPNGIALLGNLRNALNLFSFVSTIGIDQGVLKYQSEFEDKPYELKKLYESSLVYSLIGSGIMFLILFFGASYWSNYLFKTDEYNYLFIVLAITLPFTALYNLCFAIINGRSNYKKATIISFTAYALVTLFILILVFCYGLSGALIAIILTPIAQIITLIVFARSEINLFRGLKIRWNILFNNKLFVFVIMAFVAVVLNNFVEIQLRNYLIKKLSSQDAGYWTSMLSLSNYYLSFMTGVYTLYILPKYSKMNSLKVFKKELVSIYKIIIPIFVILFFGIYLFREVIIQLLYSKEFLPMQTLFKWQLMGDMVKIISVVMAYQFIAQKLWKLFIITEVVSYLVLYFLGIYLVNKMGVEGIVFAHFLRYIIYLIMVIFLVQYIFKKNTTIDESKHS